MLWSEQEKEWFAPYYDDPEGRWVDPIADGRKYCLSYVMPKWLLKSPAIIDFASREKISLLGARLLGNTEEPGYLVALETFHD